MKSIDRLREYVEKAPRTSISLMARSILLGMVRTIEQEAEDELKANDGQMWLRGYGECHAQLVEGNEVIAEDLEKAGWVKLPLDAEGVPIHVGDVVDEKLPFGGYAAPAPIDTMELSRGASGYRWMVKLDAENRALVNPKLLRHHHEPTVEDVLREMLDAWGELPSNATNEAIIAKYAAKLRLAGEE